MLSCVRTNFAMKAMAEAVENVLAHLKILGIVKSDCRNG